MTPKLLLADDSVTIQRVIELTFADENVEVVAVGDGKEAIARLQADPPDIVLADVGMPERDGYEVAEFIKADARLAHIPVLLLTGAFEPVDDARARAIGCEGVLVKPFEPQMVISRVRELLNRTRGARPELVAAQPASEPALAARDLDRLEPAAPGAQPAAGDSLEDYFDRLDAALANLGTSAPPAQVLERVAAPPEPPAVARTHESVASATVYPFQPDAVTPSGPVVDRPTPTTEAWAAPARAAGPIDVPSGPLPPLHAAFAALLAAERGEPVEVALPVQEPLSDEAMDEIARRVAARMADDRMRTIVLDTAERLVREEIERIKSQA